MEVLDSKYQTILVTGGAGFIGSHICEELLRQKRRVFCFDNFVNADEKTIEPFMDDPLFTLIRADVCDILDTPSLLNKFQGVDLVYHQACGKCTVCLLNPKLDLTVNAWGTYNVLEACRLKGVKKIVHASTGSVYGEPQYYPEDEKHPYKPVSFYGVSKLAGERYYEVFRKMYNIDYTILRYFHVYGTRQMSDDYGGVIAIFIRRAHEDKPIIIYGDGSQIRSFTFVDDVVKANIVCANDARTSGEVYNCCSGIQVSILELAKAVLKIMKKNLPIIFKDWRAGDIKYFDVSNEKISNLGVTFTTDFPTALEKVVKSYVEDFLS